MDEQRAVKYSASYDNDFHQHLIDAYIEKYRSNATVGSMVRALLQLKTEGRRIVSFMEEAQLIVNDWMKHSLDLGSAVDLVLMSL